MPNNKKEGILFGLMMVFGMAAVMYSYNLVVEGLWVTMSSTEIVINFLITMIIAFIIESFVIGPIATGVVSKLPYDKSKNWKNIIAMSTCMVTGMVLSMSVYGLVLKGMSTGIEGSSLSNYIRLIGQNFIMAYPLQLLIVGPIARWVLTTFIQNRNQTDITFSKS
ncbi:DUF2798 domain-containing protein [Paenisporosarcina sp.]|uniref:DUF2798 domain-containing protein n=1 Tax=Paenisporosarcina sp. TaxID=1932001 RepID=UPI003C7476CA